MASGLWLNAAGFWPAKSCQIETTEYEDEHENEYDRRKHISSSWSSSKNISIEHPQLVAP
jgi:hypothetical protein